jgi:hypothetical protein
MCPLELDLIEFTSGPLKGQQAILWDGDVTYFISDLKGNHIIGWDPYHLGSLNDERARKDLDRMTESEIANAKYADQ